MDDAGQPAAGSGGASRDVPTGTPTQPRPPMVPAPADAPRATQPGPVVLEQVWRRPLGIPLAIWGAVIPSALLIAAVVALAGGAAAIGAPLLVMALVVAWLVSSIARRHTETWLWRMSLLVTGRLHATLAAAARCALAWSSAASRVIRLRRQAHKAQAARDQHVHEFGEAALQGDKAQADQLRERVRELEREAAASKAQAGDALRAARRQTEDERFALQPTEVHTGLSDLQEDDPEAMP